MNSSTADLAGPPRRRWLPIVMLVVPSVLTLPVAAAGVLLSFAIGIFACFDSCMPAQGWFQSSAGTVTILIAELIIGLTALAVLITGLLAPRRRQFLGRAAWAMLLLAGTAVGLLLWSP